MYRTRNLLHAVFVVLLVISCTDDSTQVAGIDRGGIRQTSVGPIDGFGSIISNGERYEVGNATITSNGAVVTEAELQVGQVVVIDAQLASVGAMPEAETVRYESNLRGPVTMLDPINNSLVALGQNVVATSSTVFGPGIEPADISGLALADVIEVSGLVDAAGAIVATRIELKNVPYEIQLAGMATVGPGMTFSIGAQTVDYAAATVTGFPGGAPDTGDPVWVTAAAFGPGGEILALEVAYRGDILQTNAGDQGELEGLITNFVAADDFQIAGIAVTTNAQTQYSGGSVAGLANNVLIEVAGVFDATGALVASEIEYREEGNVLIEAAVDSVNADNRVTVFGIPVETTVQTTIEDKRDELRPFSLTDLSPGDYLKISGVSAGGTIIATRLERVGIEDKYKVRGPLVAIADPQFTVGGKTVQTVTGTTEFEANNADVSAPQFFAAAAACLPAGCRVAVEWETSASLTVASAVSLGD